MQIRLRFAIILVLLFVSSGLAQTATADDKDIIAGIKTLRATPDAERGAKTRDLALQIRALPANLHKVQLAVALSNIATEGDPGAEAMQAVTTTLADALKETPVPSKDGKPVTPYRDLAKLVRYEGATADSSDPQFAEAISELKAEDAQAESVHFSLEGYNLKPLGLKKVSLEDLRGKIVMLNFWATWCPPCRKEMPTLDAIYKYFKGQVVVLSITDEDQSKVIPFISQSHYSCPVLLDPGRKVAEQMHVDGIPQTFVFNRDGKLIAHAMDMRTQQQFLKMLAAAGATKPQ